MRGSRCSPELVELGWARCEHAPEGSRHYYTKKKKSQQTNQKNYNPHNPVCKILAKKTICVEICSKHPKIRFLEFLETVEHEKKVEQ